MTRRHRNIATCLQERPIVVRHWGGFVRVRPLAMFIIAAGAVFSAGCGDGGVEPPAPPAPVTGDWAGGFESDIGPIILYRTLTLTLLEETATNVTGSGAIAVTGDPDPYVTCTAVSGTHIHPAIELALTCTCGTAQCGPLTLTGTFTNESTIEAFLNGSGFQSAPGTLTRQ